MRSWLWSVNVQRPLRMKWRPRECQKAIEDCLPIVILSSVCFLECYTTFLPTFFFNWLYFFPLVSPFFVMTGNIFCTHHLPPYLLMGGSGCSYVFQKAESHKEWGIVFGWFDTSVLHLGHYKVYKVECDYICLECWGFLLMSGKAYLFPVSLHCFGGRETQL